MRIECKRDDLVAKLELVAKVASRNASLPVLQCVLITATADEIELRTTNLELGLRVVVPGKVVEPGSVAIPAATFLSTVSLLQRPIVSLVVEEGVVTVGSEGSVTKIKTFPADDFPSMPAVSSSAQKVGGGLLALGLKSVAFAVSQSNIKPELGSVCVRQKEAHSLTFVATDSFRLAEKTVGAESVVLEGSLLIPGKNAAEIVRVLEVVGEDPELSYTENQLSLSFPSGVQLVSRLVEGNFPDYEQIIPKEYQTHATVLVSDVLHALKKTNIFTNKFYQVAVGVDAEGGRLTLASENTDAGGTKEGLPATIEGTSLTLSFNQHYLHDPLTHLPDESTILSFAGIGRPMVMRGVHDKQFRYLVMPMNK